MLNWIKKVYIYLFSAVGLVLVIIGGVMLINLALKAWIFTKADVYYDYPMSKAIPTEQCDKEGKNCVQTQVQQPDQKEVEVYQRNNLSSRRQNQAATALAMIIIGAPLFFYHWRLARKLED